MIDKQHQNRKLFHRRMGSDGADERFQALRAAQDRQTRHSTTKDDSMHLILHLGPSKTGSSAIQAALQKNEEQLRRNGVHQTETNGHDLCFRYRYDKRLPPNMERRFGSLENMQAKAEESWEKFETEIRTNDYQTVIVSSEDIPAARLRDEMMERFKKSFDKITGIFYFRDPVDLYVSDLNQRIRHGLRLRHSPTPLDYDYRHLEFADWFSAHVGTDSLISRNFDRSNLVDGNAVADFFDIITRLCGLNEQFDLPSAPVNQSLPGVATVWLYTFNEILDRRIRNISANILERRSEIVRQLRQSQIVNEHENLSLKDPQLQSLIRQRAAEDLKTINEKYLVGQVPLATDDNPPVTMTNEQARERMREWFLGYMQPDAVSAISRELLG